MKKTLCFISIILLCRLSVFAQDKVFYTSGANNAKKIALSFDDGPGGSTVRVLEILKKKGVKATFFILGDKAAKHPEIARQTADEGHEIASHTHTHMNFYSYAEADKNSKIESGLTKGEKAIFAATGVKPYLVRYPYGYNGKDALDIAKKHNYKVINWTFGMDWKRDSAESMKAQYLKAIKPGAIFLMHDSAENAKVLAFLEDLIDGIIKEGYEIVTIGELLGFPAQKPAAKKVVLEEPNSRQTHKN